MTTPQKRAAVLLSFTLLLPLASRAAIINFESIYGSAPVEGIAVSNQFRAQAGVQFSRIGEVLKYDAPASRVSGYALDLDSFQGLNERLTIVAFDDTDGSNQVAQINVSPIADGRIAAWSITTETKVIRRVEIRYTGNDPVPEVGFDYFDSDITLPTPTPATLECALYAGLTIHGEASRQYRIEYAESLEQANWTALTNIFLPSSPYLFIDPGSTSAAKRFYKAIALP